MKKGQATAIRELRARAIKAVMGETELTRLAEQVLPGWKSFQVDWWLYEYRTEGDAELPQTLENKGIKKRESGYGLMHFGIGGYKDAAFMLLLKREEYEATRGIYLSDTYRYELDLVLSAPGDGGLAFINCETGAVRRQGKAFEQGISDLTSQISKEAA